MQSPRITFNAPVTLSFFILATAAMLASTVFPQALMMMAAQGPLELSFGYLLGVIAYPFAHMDWMHFIGNFSIILLIGPILEEKYSSRFLLLGW